MTGAASPLRTRLTEHAGVEVPLICGAMYPLSNPELVAAASAAGALGIVQPVTLTYVLSYDFREGLRRVRELTDRPFGMNCLIEGSSRTYRRRMEAWLDTALEEGVRFVVTSLGKPDWVAERVHAAGGVVYHDVTERKWALKGRDAGVDGLIAVNRRAGGHPGPLEPPELLEQIGDLGLPVVCAGGVGAPADFVAALRMGYDGVQMGTRFIATEECVASEAYKRAVVEADADDIVWSERITGVPVAVLNTPAVQAMGTRAGPLARRLLRGRRTKHWMRTLYTLASMWRLKRSAKADSGARGDVWQAGRSVAGIHEVLPAGEVVRRFRRALVEGAGVLVVGLSAALALASCAPVGVVAGEDRGSAVPVREDPTRAPAEIPPDVRAGARPAGTSTPGGAGAAAQERPSRGAPSSEAAATCPDTPAQRLLAALNLVRTDAGLPPLRVDRRLTAAAVAHAEDLARAGGAGHRGSDGSGPAERASAAGYAWTLVGENVATGYATPSAAAAGWMASPSHRRNVLAPGFTDVGLAYLYAPGSTWRTYWVAVFGASGSSAEPFPRGCAGR